MHHVGHSVRWGRIQSLKIVLMGADNHQVWANVGLMAGAFRRLPGAEIHVRDTDTVNLRRSPGNAVLYPAQEYRVEAPRLIVRISRNSRSSPFPISWHGIPDSPMNLLTSGFVNNCGRRFGPFDQIEADVV
jgi:hypothetical protein